ncbi:MAG: hypothetical protein K0R73_1350 [Candidatus Midichloriaceae bacterium]|jgi:uncharacterized phage protein (TIGR02218 family)|nr:hypothetical protein [Candidatus Midichloriaceae bacterium]
MKKESIKAEVLTLTTCWKVKLRSGEVLGFTEAEKDLTIDGVLYHAKGGFSRSAIESDTTLAPDNLEAEGVIDHDIINHEDLLSGKFDHAKVSIFLVDVTHPESGKLQLRTGFLGEVTLNDSGFTAEIRGLLQAFSQTIGELYSPQCRAQLGDARCKIDLKSKCQKGKIQKVISTDAFISTLPEADGYYKYGKIKFNCGFETEVIEHLNNKIILAECPPTGLRANLKFEIYTGCDRALPSCINKFQNAINFRGEPFINEVERLLF